MSMSRKREEIEDVKISSDDLKLKSVKLPLFGFKK